MLRTALAVAIGVGGAWQLHRMEPAQADEQPLLCRHGQLELTGSDAVPALMLHAERDAASGWNLRIDARDFRFAPERANGAHVPGEGHAHLYVDGQKAARLYGPWYHLPSLGAGTHALRVTLNANDHRELALGGQVIASTLTLRE
ncbi:MAG: hypothetical protein VYC42_06620 [Pseudomonadota bacterium]|nr:hypothetical protein [Pseudomonadota bacterium]